MKKKLVICVILFVFFPSLAKAQFQNFIDDTPEIIKDSATVTKEWEKLESLLKYIIREGTKALMPLIMDNMQSVNISSTCIRDAMLVFGGMQKLQTWALRFLDSSAKGIDGVITGTSFSFGSYDECLDTVALNQRSGKHKGEVLFTGKYCLLRVKAPLPPKKPTHRIEVIMDELKGFNKEGTMMNKLAKYAAGMHYLSARLGLCVPSGCSVDDINQLFSIVSNYTSLYLKVKRCETKHPPKYTPLMIFVMSLYSFAGFMVLLGTVIDVYCYYFGRKLNSMPVRVLLCFSFVSNFRKFVDTSTSSKTLSCLNGIRFLSMSWVIHGHTYGLALLQVVSGMEYVKYILQGFPIQVVLNGTMSVETFFFIGGLLTCYVTVNHVKIGHKKFSVKVYIIHRLWRILPVYTFVILFVFLSELIVSGPVAYSSTFPMIDGCKKNWWASLLFINNFYHTDNLCVPHGWYLTVDVQLYIGSLIILLPLLRWPKVGISIAIVTIMGFITTCGIIVYINDYKPLGVLHNPNIEGIVDTIISYYIKPYPHVGPYIIGILVGYLLAIKPDLKIPKMIQLFGWCTAITLGLSVVYGTHGWNLGREPMLWEKIFYISLNRLVWTMSVAWMVVCCATGHGGVVNYILSWKLWIPLGRLTFIAYLSHMLVIPYYVGIIGHPLTPKVTIAVWHFIGHLVITYGVSFAGSMLIEAPFLSLEKLLMFLHDDKLKNKTEKDVTDTLRIKEIVKEPESSLTSNHNCSGVSGLYKGTENLGYVYKL